MEGTDMDVVYSATSSPHDPAGENSINTTSENLPSIFKTNFWPQTRKTVELPGSVEKQTQGGRGYGQLITDTNWWAAEDIPIMPVDNNGIPNAYPLMKISRPRY